MQTLNTENHAACHTAVIDCGSNSFRLLIANTKYTPLKEVLRDLVTVRLGEGLTAQGGIITPKAWQRAMSALRSFATQVKQYGISCDEVLCTGTSALRTAVNGQEFVSTVREEVGLDINVISGYQEAWLSYRGASRGIVGTRLDHSLGVIDIGGGSTELAFFNGSEFSAVSTPLGAVRLTNMFIKHDPPSVEELNDLKKHIYDTCSLAFPKPAIRQCIGVAGTITNLAAVHHRLVDYQPEIVHNSSLTYTNVSRILNMLCNLNVEEMRSVVGLQPERADIIVAGTVILLNIMEYLKVNTLVVSEWDGMHALAAEGWVTLNSIPK